MTVKDAFALVRTSYKNGRLPHAFILAGEPRGAGTSLATDICRMLLCRETNAKLQPSDLRPQPLPCGVCADCDLVGRRAHADTLWVEPEKKSRVIGVDTVRDTILPWAVAGSYPGGWKICVMLFADRLNESAANAFLKTLEEPAERTLFLLVTDSPENLLPTVISRCQRINLSEGRCPPAEPWRSKTQEILAKHSTASALRVYATAGSLVSLFDEIKEQAEELGKEQRKNSEIEEDAETSAAWVSARAKEMRAAVFATIKEWYRDILIVTTSSSSDDRDDGPLFNEEHAEIIAEKAATCDPKLAIQFVKMTNEMMSQIENRNMRENLVFPYWFTWLK